MVCFSPTSLLHIPHHPATLTSGDIGFYEGNQKWFTVEQSPLSEARLLAQVELFRYHLAQNYKERDKHNTPFTTIEVYFLFFTFWLHFFCRRIDFSLRKLWELIWQCSSLCVDYMWQELISACTDCEN